MLECDQNAGDGKPEYLAGIHCDVQFLWKTSHVCPLIQNTCAVNDGGHLYDLSFLSKTSGAWDVKDKAGNT